MNAPEKRGMILRLAFYMGSIAFILAVWQIQKNITGDLMQQTLQTLDPLQQKELDAFLEMNKLITTLSTGLLGALSFILVNRGRGKNEAAQWTAYLSAICVGLSLFFGYVVYLAVVNMLDNHYFQLFTWQIQWARQAHFYTFFLAVVLFGDFAFHALRKEDEDEPTQDALGH
jgi:cytochrome bd-type quinol oxidase subunit 2